MTFLLVSILTLIASARSLVIEAETRTVFSHTKSAFGLNYNDTRWNGWKLSLY